MYPTSGQLILGFHGCEQQVKSRILSSKTRLHPSTNNWDWLGHGIYFWEADEKRALEYASIGLPPTRALRKPSVIGAVIDLGKCLNLLNRNHIAMLKRSYSALRKSMALEGKPMPRNRTLRGGNQLLLRDLDCAVINYLHGAMKLQGQRQFDSVRAAFWEGDRLYPDAGFHELSHIQICVRNPNCIKGYFDPLKSVRGWPQI